MSFLDDLGDVFVGGLAKAVDTKLSPTDASRQYAALPDGRLVDVKDQRVVSAPPATNYKPYLIAGGVAVGVLVLILLLRK